MCKIPFGIGILCTAPVPCVVIKHHLCIFAVGKSAAVFLHTALYRSISVIGILCNLLYSAVRKKPRGCVGGINRRSFRQCIFQHIFRCALGDFCQNGFVAHTHKIVFFQFLCRTEVHIFSRFTAQYKFPRVLLLNFLRLRYKICSAPKHNMQFCILRQNVKQNFRRTLYFATFKIGIFLTAIPHPGLVRRNKNLRIPLIQYTVCEFSGFCRKFRIPWDIRVRRPRRHRLVNFSFYKFCLFIKPVIWRLRQKLFNIFIDFLKAVFRLDTCNGKQKHTLIRIPHQNTVQDFARVCRDFHSIYKAR